MIVLFLFFSFFLIIQIYEEDPFAGSVECGLEELFLTGRETNELKKLMPKLVDLDSVMVALQKKNFNLSDSRILLDSVIQKYPELSSYISEDANILHTPSFDKAIVKIANGKHDSLTIDEKDSVAMLLKPV